MTIKNSLNTLSINNLDNLKFFVKIRICVYAVMLLFILFLYPGFFLDRFFFSLAHSLVCMLPVYLLVLYNVLHFLVNKLNPAFTSKPM